MKKSSLLFILCIVAGSMGGQTRNFVVKSDAITVLMAKEAVLQGGLKHWRIDPIKYFWVENWNDSEQSFTWNLTLKKKDVYKVNIIYATSEKVSGSDQKVTVELIVNEKKTERELTLHPYWDRNESEQTIELAAGDNVLSIRLAPKSGNFQSMQLYSIELIRPEVEKQMFARAATLHSKPQWISDAKYGLFFHWNSKSMPQRGEAKSYQDAVESFDISTFAKTIHECGADFIIFTTSWAGYFFPAPLQSIEKILPGRTTHRDFVDDLSTELSKYGIKLMLYYHEGYDDKDWWDKQGFNAPEAGSLFTNIQSIMEEISTRYKDKVAGLFLDDGMYYYAYDAPFEAITEAAKTGNKDLIIAYNPWIFPKMTPFQDYFAGEFGLNMDIAQAYDWNIDNGGYFTSGPQKDLRATFCGLLEPDEGDWTHRGKDTDIASPGFTLEEITKIMQTAIARKNIPVINVAVYQDGHIGPETFNLLKKMATILKPQYQ
jgi:hypothetical protein